MVLVHCTSTDCRAHQNDLSWKQKVHGAGCLLENGYLASLYLASLTKIPITERFVQERS